MASALPALAAFIALLAMAACEPPSGQSITASEDMARSAGGACDSADREVGIGEATRVCVQIGHASVIRLGPGAPGENAVAEVCNETDVKQVWVAWTGGDRPIASGTANPDAIWEGSQGRRRALPAHGCRTVGPAGVVVLRGWHDAGQGFDVATDWRGTVTFRRG